MNDRLAPRVNEISKFCRAGLSHRWSTPGAGPEPRLYSVAIVGDNGAVARADRQQNLREQVQHALLAYLSTVAEASKHKKLYVKTGRNKRGKQKRKRIIIKKKKVLPCDSLDQALKVGSRGLLHGDDGVLEEDDVHLLAHGLALVLLEGYHVKQNVDVIVEAASEVLAHRLDSQAACTSVSANRHTDIQPRQLSSLTGSKAELESARSEVRIAFESI